MIQIKIACVSNLWVRQIHFTKKGDVNESHEHTYDHITLIAKGSFKVTVEGETKLVTAPHMVYIIKNKLHYIEALEDDSTACCIHALRTGEREEDILEPSMTFDYPTDKGVTDLVLSNLHPKNKIHI